MALLFGTVLAVAFMIEKPLYLPGQDEQNHTHAFDLYTSPFHGGESGLAATVVSRWQAGIGLDGKCGLIGLAALLVLGGSVHLLDRKWSADAFFERGAEDSFRATSLSGRALSPSVLGGTALTGLVAFSIFACYIVYPEPKETLEDMRIVGVVALTSAISGEWETAERHLKIWEDLSRKLEVGVFLRQFGLSDERKQATEQLRAELRSAPSCDREERQGEGPQAGLNDQQRSKALSRGVIWNRHETESYNYPKSIVTTEDRGL